MIDTITLFPLDPIEVGPGLNFICIQDPQLLFHIVQCLTQETQSEERISLSRDSESYPVDKSILLIGDPLEPTDLNSLFLKEAMSRLTSNLTEEDLRDLDTISHELMQRVQRIIDMNDFDLEMVNSQFEPKMLIQFPKPRFEIASWTKMIQKLQAIIDIAGALDEPRMLVTFHISKYCSKEELELLSKDILRQGLQVIDIDQGDRKIDISDGRSQYVDEDFVQFS